MLIASLLPLLGRYSLGLDLVAGPDETVTLTVIPRKAEGAKQTLDPAEVRPIAITATAAEIDAELAAGLEGALGQLVAARKALGDQLAEQRAAAEQAKSAAAAKPKVEKPAKAEKPPKPEKEPPAPKPAKEPPPNPMASLWGDPEPSATPAPTEPEADVAQAQPEPETPGMTAKPALAGSTDQDPEPEGDISPVDHEDSDQQEGLEDAD